MPGRASDDLIGDGTNLGSTFLPSFERLFPDFEREVVPSEFVESVEKCGCSLRGRAPLRTRRKHGPKASLFVSPLDKGSARSFESG
jgi:hypothetical protein